MFRYIYSQLLLGCLNFDLFLVLWLLTDVLHGKRSSITLGKEWIEYLNIKRPILCVTNLEIGSRFRSLKIGSVWHKCGKKVIMRTIFFWILIRGSKYFFGAVPYTSTQYVKYGKTKALYNFSKVSLFKYFRALVIMPKPLEILFLV